MILVANFPSNFYGHIGYITNEVRRWLGGGAEMVKISRINTASLLRHVAH